jgi:hypothetical protein
MKDAANGKPMMIAAEIPKAAKNCLRTCPSQARSQLPADWAPLLPLEVGSVVMEPGDQISIGGWCLTLDGNRAQLDAKTIFSLLGCDFSGIFS